MSGLGVTIVGALARWGIGAMLANSASFLGDFDAFTNFIYNGSHHAVSEWDTAQWELLNNSPALHMQRFALGFATVIIVVGVVMIIVGTVLAVVLYQKRNSSPDFGQKSD